MHVAAVEFGGSGFADGEVERRDGDAKEVVLGRARVEGCVRPYCDVANAQSIGRPKPAGPFAIVAIAAQSHAEM